MAEEFGKYRLIKKIAQGGMAEVFLATQSAAVPGFEKQIAIKRIFPNLATDENMRTMFLDEATIAARLNHPNIVQIYDVGEVDQYLFLAMEYVEGYDFRNVLVKAQQKGVTVPYPLAVNVIMNAAAGLHHAHALVGSDGKAIKVIHRDMSPQNILVSKGGNVKVCDFGVAKAEVRAGMTRAGELKGKISYMSPEQIEGSVEIDHRSDIFSLGVVLYEATTMTRLFRQGTDYEKMRNILDGNIRPPTEVTPGYPTDLEEIVLKCLANNREERFQTAKELQVALDGWLSRTGVSQSALELERFLAFLFEDAPISPTSSEPGTPSALFNERERGSQSRRLAVPKLDSLVSKSNPRIGNLSSAAALEEENATPFSPVAPQVAGGDFLSQLAERREKILEKSFESFSVGNRLRSTGANRAAVENQSVDLPVISGRVAPPKNPYATPLPGYYNVSQDNSPDALLQGFSKRQDQDLTDELRELAGSHHSVDAHDDFDLSDSSIEQAIPTAEYQVIPRSGPHTPQNLQYTDPVPSEPREAALVSAESVLRASMADGASQASLDIQRGAPPKRRNPRASEIDLEDPLVKLQIDAPDPSSQSSQVEYAAPSTQSSIDAPGMTTGVTATGGHPANRRPTRRSLNDDLAAAAAASTSSLTPPSSSSTSNYTHSDYVEPWDEGTKKKDGGMLPLILIFLVLAGAGGGFYYYMKVYAPSQEASGEAAATPSKSALPDQYVMTKLQAYEPNVSWVVNGRVPEKVEGNDVALLKGKENLVTAYKTGFFPGYDRVQGGAAQAPRVNMRVDKNVPDGVLKIESTPPGASVFVDGESRGTTPTEIKKLSRAYPHNIVLKLQDHGTYITYVTVTTEGTVLNPTLKKGAPTNTEVNFNIKPEGASLLVDGQPLAMPAKKSVKSGSFVQVAPKDAQYFPFEYQVDTTNVSQLDFDFSLIVDDRPRGTLSLKVEPPGTRIFVGEKPLGSNVIDKMSLLAGKVPLVLEGPGGRARMDLEIRPGKDNLYQLELAGSEIKVKKRPPLKTERRDGEEDSEE